MHKSVIKDDDSVTDKELKKLSRLELLELLLAETRENEKLREELAKAKKENSIEKSAVILNETAKQLDEALQKVSTAGFSPAESDSKKSDGKKSGFFGFLKSAAKSSDKKKSKRK